MSPRIHRGLGLGLVFPVVEGKQSQRPWERISVFYKKWACTVMCSVEAEWQYSRPFNALMLRNPMGFMEMLQKSSLVQSAVENGDGRRTGRVVLGMESQQRSVSMS
jgi:hypothetical protein